MSDLEPGLLGSMPGMGCGANYPNHGPNRTETAAMRTLVVILAVLAGLKVWTQHSLFRAATEDALLRAYAARAVKTCQRSVKADHRGQPLGAGAIDWSKYRSAKLMIGDPTVDVSIWQVDNELWNKRFKNPYILLKIEHAHWPATCAYDIVAGRAALVEL